MANCSRCGKSLKRISYVQPDWEGHYRDSLEARSPLCKPCWEKADREEVAKHEVAAAKGA